MLRNVLTFSTVIGLVVMPTQMAHAQFGGSHVIAGSQAQGHGNTADVSMHSGNLAEQVSQTVAQANTAVANCDKASYESAMRTLERTKDDIRGASEMSAEAAARLGVNQEHAKNDAEAVETAMRNISSGWAGAQPCGGEKAEATGIGAISEDDAYDTALRYAGEFGAIRVSSGVKAGVMNLNGIPGYIGSENGAATRTLGDVKQDDTGTLAGFNIETRLPLGYVPNWIPNWPNMPNVPNTSAYNPLSFWDFFMGLEHMSANFNEVQSEYSPGAGRQTLLTGVGAGPSPSGYALAAGAASDVTNIAYDADYDFGSYELGFGKTVRLPNSDVVVRPFGGLRYAHYDVNQHFMGTTNSGALDFAYGTNIKNRSVGPFVGVEAEKRVRTSIFGATPFKLSANLRYGYDFNDADGDDTLTVSGGPNQTGTVDLSEDNGSHDVRAGFSVTLTPDSPFNVTLGGEYQRTTGSPEVNRDGTGPSNLSLDSADIWLATVRAGLSF